MDDLAEPIRTSGGILPVGEQGEAKDASVATKVLDG